MTPLVHLLVMLTTPLAPLVLALALMLRPTSQLLQRAALLAPVPALVTSLLIAPGIGATLPWLLEGSEFGLDAIGRLFLLFSAAIWLAAAAYSITSIPAARRGRFLVFFLLAMSGNLGAIVARDMLAFYLFFSLMSFAAYGLVVHDGTPRARRAGALYVALVVAGDMMLYAALVPASLDAGGTVLLAGVREAITESPHRNMIIGLVVAGFGVKAGAIGLHVTLPLIYRAAPIAAGAALAGPMLHAGLLGWLRFLPLGTELSDWGLALIVLGLAGTFYGALIGCAQRDATAVLAYSSISQMGIMLAALGAALRSPEHAGGIVAAVAVYALHHALVKSALFLGVGIASGGGRVVPAAIRAGLLLPALALPGVPLSSGSLAKEYLKEEIGAVGAGWSDLLAELLPWTALATTLIVARFLWLIWPLTDRAASEADARPRPVPSRIELAAWLSMLILAAVAVWLQPIERPPELWSTEVVLELTWPVVIGTVAALLIASGAAAGRIPRLPLVPAGDVVVPILRGLRPAAAGWQRFASGPLPRVRDAIRARSRAGLSADRWSSLTTAAEQVLGRWNAAVTGFVLAAILFAILLMTS